jgi:hypothetical protein
MKILKWVLLGLYIIIIIGLLGMTYYHGENLTEKLFLTILLFVATIIAQTVFILGVGTADLCTPIKKRRLIIPVIIAAVMMTVLIAGITLALGELIFKNQGEWFAYVFWAIVAINWLAWGFIFFIWGMRTQRYKTLRNVISTMFAGSLLSLVISIPSHLIVVKRPGCLVGLSTALGIISGIFVMLWAFGPGIILLFLREIRKAQLLRNANGR